MNFSSTEPPNFKKIVLAEILQIDFKIDLMLYTEPMAAGGKECPPPCIDCSQHRHLKPWLMSILGSGAVVENVNVV